jgi:hypothetical protein
MNETENSAVVEESSDGWDDITFTDEEVAAGEEPSDEGAAAENPEADQPTDETAEQEPEAEGTQTEAGGTDQSFELKHLDETRTVNRDEVIELAQKGMDYDRVRQKYDAAKESIEWYGKNADSVRWLEEIAKDQGMSFEELVDSTRAQIMANKTNQSLAVCRGIVANERKALQLEAQKKALEAKSADSTQDEQAKARMQEDVKAFAAAYPEQARDPEKSIPKEVWDEVRKGETLVNAYRAWENKQLKLELEKREQENKNRSRSTGSQRTAGNKTADAFDSLWYNGD